MNQQQLLNRLRLQDQEINGLRHQLSRYSARSGHINFEQKYKKALRQISGIIQANNQLKDQLQKLRMSRQSQMQRQIRTYKQQCNKLCDKLLKEKNDLSMLCDTLQLDKQELMNQIEVLSIELERLRDNELSEAQNREANKMLNRKKGEVKINYNVQKLQEQLQFSQNNYHDVSRANRRLQERNNELQSKLLLIDKTWRNKFQNKEEELRGLKNVLRNQFRQQIDIIRHENNALKSNNSELEVKLQALQIQRPVAESQFNYEDDFVETLRELRSQMQPMKKTIIELQQMNTQQKQNTFRQKAQLQRRVIELQSEIDKYTEQIHNLQNKLIISNQQILNLEDQKKTIKKLEQENRMLGGRVIVLQSKDVSLRNRTGQQLQERVLQFQTRIQMLLNEKQSYNNIKSISIHQMLALKAYIMQLDAKLKALLAQNEYSLKKYKNYKQKFSNSIQTIKQYDITIHSLKTKIQGYDRLVLKMQSEIQSMLKNNQIQFSTIKMNQKNESHYNSETYMKQCNNLKDKLTLEAKYAKQELETMKLHYETKIVQLTIKLEEMKSLKQTIDLYKIKNGDLTNRLAEKENENMEIKLQANSRILTASNLQPITNKQTKQLIINLNQTIKMNDATILKLQNELKMQMDASEKKRLALEQQMEETIAQLRKNKDIPDDKVKDVKEDLRKAKNRIIQLEAEKEHMKTSKQSDSRTHSKIMQQANRINALEMQNEDMKFNLNSETNLKKRLQSQLQQYLQANQQLESQMIEIRNKLQRKNQEMQQQMEYKQFDINRLRNINNGDEEQYRRYEMENKNREINRLNEEIIELRNEKSGITEIDNNRLRLENKQLKIDVDELNQTISRANIDIQKLRDKRDNENNQYENVILNKDTEIHRLRQQLLNTNLNQEDNRKLQLQDNLRTLKRQLMDAKMEAEEVQNLRKTVLQKDLQLNNSKFQIREYQEDLMRAKNQIVYQKELYQKLTNQIINKNEDYGGISQGTFNKDYEIKKLKSQNDQLQFEKNELDTKISNLNNEVRRLRQRMQNQSNDYEQKIPILERQVSRLRQQVLHREEDIQYGRIKIQGLEETIRALRRQISQLRIQTQQISQLKRLLRERDHKINNLSENNYQHQPNPYKPYQYQHQSSKYQSNPIQQYQHYKYDQKPKITQEQQHYKYDEKPTPTDNYQHFKYDQKPITTQGYQHYKYEERSKPTDYYQNYKYDERSKPTDDYQNYKYDERPKPTEEYQPYKYDEKPKQTDNYQHYKYDVYNKQTEQYRPDKYDKIRQKQDQKPYKIEFKEERNQFIEGQNLQTDGRKSKFSQIQQDDYATKFKKQNSLLDFNAKPSLIEQLNIRQLNAEVSSRTLTQLSTLRSENTQLKYEIDQLNNTIIRLNNEIMRLRKRIDQQTNQYDQEIIRRDRQISKLKQQFVLQDYNKQDTKIQGLEDTVRTLRRELGQTRAQAQQVDGLHRALRERDIKINSLTYENKQYEQDLINLRNEIAYLKQVYQKGQYTILQREDEISKLSLQISNLKYRTNYEQKQYRDDRETQFSNEAEKMRKITKESEERERELENQIYRLKNQIQFIRSQKDRLLGENEDMNARINNKQQQVFRMNSELNRLRETDNQLFERDSKISKLNMQIRSLNIELESIREQKDMVIARINNDLEYLRQNSNKIQNELSSKNQLLSQQNTELSLLKIDHTGQLESYAQKQALIQRLRQQIYNMRMNHQLLQQQIQNKQLQWNSINTQLKSANQVSEQMVQKQQIINKLRRQINRLKNEIERLNEEIHDKNIEIGVLNKQIFQLKLQSNNRGEQIMGQVEREMGLLRKKNTALQNQVAEREGQITKLRYNIENTIKYTTKYNEKMQIDDIQQELNKKQRMIIQLNAQLRNKDEQVLLLQNKVGLLQKSKISIEKYNEEDRDKMQKQIERLLLKQREWKQEINKLNSQIDRRGNEDQRMKISGIGTEESKLYRTVNRSQQAQHLKQGIRLHEQQIQRLNKIIEQFKQQIELLRLKLTEYTNQQDRIQQNLITMVLTFTEVEALRIRLKNKENQISNVRKSLISYVNSQKNYLDDSRKQDDYDLDYSNVGKPRKSHIYQQNTNQNIQSNVKPKSEMQLQSHTQKDNVQQPIQQPINKQQNYIAQAKIRQKQIKPQSTLIQQKQQKANTIISNVESINQIMRQEPHIKGNEQQSTLNSQKIITGNVSSRLQVGRSNTQAIQKTQAQLEQNEDGSIHPQQPKKPILQYLEQPRQPQTLPQQTTQLQMQNTLFSQLQQARPQQPIYHHVQPIQQPVQQPIRQYQQPIQSHQVTQPIHQIQQRQVQGQYYGNPVIGQGQMGFVGKIHNTSHPGVQISYQSSDPRH